MSDEERDGAHQEARVAIQKTFQEVREGAAKLDAESEERARNSQSSSRCKGFLRPRRRRRWFFL